MTRTLDTADAYGEIEEYYGKTLRSGRDLRTKACCCTDSMPAYVEPILAEIDEEITNRFYGCGSPIPLELEGRTVLDLGCGTGRDVYIVSKLAGPTGRVIGVDMTEEQLSVARRHMDSQMERFGFSQPNVEFLHGRIEDLREIGIVDNSTDVVISNCVINLSPDKQRVFSEIFRVLKPGGELYFSDIFAGRRVPEPLAVDPLLRGECLGGAMYVEDFRRLLRGMGCPDYRVMSRRRIVLDDPEIVAKAGMIDFYSMTVRVFKLQNLEDICEDYGQVAVYRGTVPQSPHFFVLDDHHTFPTGKQIPVCGNTAAMLQETRFAKHFKVSGNRSAHYGPFDCSSTIRATDARTNSAGSCC